MDREDGKAVLTVVDGKVQIRPVKVQKEVGTEAFVSTGLTGTEAIIVGDQVSQLKPGDRVEVK